MSTRGCESSRWVCAERQVGTDDGVGRAHREACWLRCESDVCMLAITEVEVLLPGARGECLRTGGVVAELIPACCGVAAKQCLTVMELLQLICVSSAME